MESGTTIPPTPSSPTDQLMSEKTRKDIIFLTNCFAGELLTSVFATTEIDQSPSPSSSTALDAVSSIKSYLPDFIDVQEQVAILFLKSLTKHILMCCKSSVEFLNDLNHSKSTVLATPHNIPAIVERMDTQMNVNMDTFDQIKVITQFIHTPVFYECCSPSNKKFSSSSSSLLNYSKNLQNLSMKLFRTVAHIIRSSVLDESMVDAALDFIKIQQKGNEFLSPDVVEDPLSAVEVAAMIGHSDKIHELEKVSEKLHVVMNLPIDVWAENSLKIRDKRVVSSPSAEDYSMMDKILTVNKGVGLFLNNNQKQSIYDYLLKYRYYIEESARVSEFRNNLSGRMVLLLNSMVAFFTTTRNVEVGEKETKTETKTDIGTNKNTTDAVLTPLTKQGATAVTVIDAASECATKDHDFSSSVHSTFVIIDDYFRFVNNVYSILSSKVHQSAIYNENFTPPEAATTANGGGTIAKNGNFDDYDSYFESDQFFNSLSMFTSEWVSQLIKLGHDCKVVSSRCKKFTSEIHKLVDKKWWGFTRHGPTINERAHVDDIHEVCNDIEERVTHLEIFACKCGEVVGELAAYNTEKICEVVISKQRYGTELFNPSIKRKNLAKIFINSLLKIVVGIDGGIFLCLNTVFSRTVETLLEWFDDIQAVFTVEGAEDFKNECMGLIDWLIAKKNESKATEEFYNTVLESDLLNRLHAVVFVLGAPLRNAVDGDNRELMTCMEILSDLDKWLSLRSDKGKKDLSGSGEDGARRGGEGGGVAISRRIKQLVEYAKTNHLHSNLNGW
ncbi:hypothetical protein ScalyP_jg2824 [Parmales sp. scaly parma]|nr:hypothetical protein ScalyP_jg2824 [Parmales sp. scaly parma]